MRGLLIPSSPRASHTISDSSRVPWPWFAVSDSSHRELQSEHLKGTVYLSLNLHLDKFFVFNYCVVNIFLAHKHYFFFSVIFKDNELLDPVFCTSIIAVQLNFTAIRFTGINLYRDRPIRLSGNCNFVQALSDKKTFFGLGIKRVNQTTIKIGILMKLNTN